MALNPLTPIDNTRVATAFRPQLKIAARNMPDARVRRGEPASPDYQWRRTFDAIKESVAGAIDTFVTNAAAEASAAAEETRAQATIEKVELLAEITRQQLVIDSLQSELLSERDKLQCMRSLIASEVTARLRSESERDVALQQLDAALTQRSTPAVSLQSVQHPASFEVIDEPAPASTTVADQITVGDAHPEVVEDIKRALEQVKDIYDLDAKSALSSAELVDSLTTRLRQARDVVVARSSISERETIALFEQQIDAMLDSSAGSFSRHLSISAYAASTS